MWIRTTQGAFLNVDHLQRIFVNSTNSKQLMADEVGREKSREIGLYGSKEEADDALMQLVADMLITFVCVKKPQDHENT